MAAQDLWSFIKSRKSIESASLKVLQKFMLSLSKNELINILNCYLQSTLHTVTSPNGLTYRESANILLNKTENNTGNNNNTFSNSISKQILYKLNKKFRNNKIVTKIQQNCTQNKHLLSVNPEALAYSFQFLSYKELCKIQTVSIYFTYITKKYHGLAHYFIKMDQKLLLNIMKNKIDLNQLSQFKHIKITHMYFSKCRYNPDMKRQSILFKHIIKTIIFQSMNQLHTLTINISWNCISENYWYISQKSWALHHPAFNVLLQIINQFKCLPNIKSLHLNRDIFKPSTNASAPVTIQQIIQNMQLGILKCFPNIKHFTFGIDRLDNYYSSSHFDQVPLCTFKQLLIIPMINYYHQLETLDLYFNSSSYYSWILGADVIQLIVINLKNLKKLSISTVIDKLKEFAETETIRKLKSNLSVRELNVKIYRKRGPYGLMQDCDYNHIIAQQKFLSHLFSSFIGIDTFGMKCVRSTSDDIQINWEELLCELVTNKRVYSITNNEEIRVLKSLDFQYCSSFDQVESICDALVNLQNELYLDIKHLGIDINQNDFYNKYGYKQLLCDHLIPIMSTFDGLHSIQFKFNTNMNEDIDEFSFEPILNVLSNLPKSLAILELNLPYYGKNHPIKEGESTKLVKKLCEMLVSDNDSKLHTIVLDKFQVCSKAKDFLMFMFGYNNKLYINEDKCYLSFI